MAVINMEEQRQQRKVKELMAEVSEVNDQLRRRPRRVQPRGTAIIHVNRHHIARNAKDGGDRPIYTTKVNGETIYAREVIIHGASRCVYNGEQLSCGARAWIETESEIELVDPMTFKEATQV